MGGGMFSYSQITLQKKTVFLFLQITLTTESTFELIIYSRVTRRRYLNVHFTFEKILEISETVQLYMKQK